MKTVSLSFRARAASRLRIIAVAGAILFAHSAAADEWPYYQHDASHTGNSTAIVEPLALSFAWTPTSSPTGYSTPLIDGNRVYAMQNQQGIGASQTTVTSFDLPTGAINWSYTGKFVFPSQPAVAGGFVVFVGSNPGNTALYVLDKTTGALRYTMPGVGGSVMPTLVADSATGNITAFVAGNSQVTAVALGETSGSVLWTRSGSFGGQSIPTVVGASIVLAGPDQYYAFDRATGAANQFWHGSISGGGGCTVAFDAARQQFYVLEFYNGATTTLSAYHYIDNANIALLWQRTGAGIRLGGSVAIGATGNVYSVGNTVAWELDPTTGVTVRTVTGLPSGAGGTPALTANVLWIVGNMQVLAYDLVTLQLLQTFGGSRRGSNTYPSPGAFADGYFVLENGNLYGSPSFNVYSAPVLTPTPTATATVTPTATATATPTATASATATSTPTATASATATATSTPTATASATATPTSTPTPTPTSTATATPTSTATATPTAAPTTARTKNISTRLRVEPGDNALIGGFIITGSGPKKIVIRGLGPSLLYRGLSVALADPVVQVRGSNNGLLVANDNWRDTQEAEIEGTPFEPQNDLESVIIVTLQPGAYTAVLSGKDQGAGVGLIEIYDADPAQASELANISTRGFIQTGENVMIGGFMLGESSGSTRVAVRGLGPSLSQSGLNNVLQNPTLELHDGNGALLVSNDDWEDNPVSAAELIASGLAPPNRVEAGILTSLPSGMFTVILAGKNGGIGIGLVEIYNLH